MVDIKSPTAEIREEKDRRKIEIQTSQGKNIMACPIPQGGHN